MSIKVESVFYHRGVSFNGKIVVESAVHLEKDLELL